MGLSLWAHVLRHLCLQVMTLEAGLQNFVLTDSVYRAFTLAVFLKETLHNDKTDAPWAILILSIMLASNVTLFR